MSVRKRLIILWGLAAIITGVVLFVILRPGLPGRPASDAYLPLRAGNTWTFASPSGQLVMRVVSVRQAGDNTEFQIEETQHGGSSLLSYRQDAMGLFLMRRESAGQVEDYSREPQPMLLLPPHPGLVWTWQGSVGKRRYGYQAAVGKPETIETPAGTFPGAVPVQITITDVAERDKPLRNQQWLVPGVGFARLDYQRNTGEEVRYVLSAYHLE